MSNPARRSPSGPPIPIDGLLSDEVDNVSSVPGSSLTIALDALLNRQVRYLDVNDDPLALWNFADTLNAVRGPNITTTTGEWGFTSIYPGVRALMVNVGARLSAPVTSSIILTGAMSAEMIVQFNSFPIAWICGVGGTVGSASAADNVTWSTVFNPAGVPRNLTTAWETGSGSAVSFATSSAPGAAALPPVHNIMSIGFSRASNGVVQPYFNGRVLGGPSGVLTLPTNGSNGAFSIGGQIGAVATQSFALMSVALYNRARPASEWLASYNRSMGHGLGFIVG